MSQHTFEVTYRITVTAPDRLNAASYARQMVEHGHDAIEAHDAAGSVILTPPMLGAATSAPAGLHRIRLAADRIRDGIGVTATPGRALPRAKPAEPADEDLAKNLAAALDRAADLQGNTTDPEKAARIGQWIARALAARNLGDSAEIRRLLATPYQQPGDDGSAAS